MDKQYPQRKNMRHPSFNYSNHGACFITICTKEKKCILSNIVKGEADIYPKVMLTDFGKIAEKYINQLNDFYDDICVKQYVIMPNHIHMILQVNRTVEMNVIQPHNIPAKSSKISLFLSTFKRFCNKEFGENIWQARSFDHVIRNEYDYSECMKYINNNPRKWYYSFITDESIRK